MGGHIILTIAVIANAWAQQPAYSNLPIPSPSGLYLEGLSKVRMVKGQWTIITSLDMEDLHRHAEPLYTVNSRYGDICFDIVDECRIYYLKIHRWTLADKDIRDRWEQLQDFLRPLSDSLGIDYLLHSSNLDTEEQEYLNSVIPYTTWEKKVNYEKQTTYIPNGLKDIIRILDSRKQQIKDQLTVLAELRYEPEEGVDLFSNITETTDSIVELRKYLYESLIEVITNSKIGQIHPLTFRRKELRRTLTTLTEHEPDTTLPLLNDGLGLTQLQDVIQMKLIMKQGRIIIIVYIPFIEQQESDLYYLHPHPVLQHIGLKTKVFGQINNPSSYLLIKTHTQQYGYPTLQYLTNLCKNNNQYLICDPSLVLYPIDDDSHCEISLTKPSESKTPFKCDITILPSIKDQWVTLNRPGEWLYSLTELVTGKIVCGKAAVASIQLSNYGKITLRRGCKIFVSNTNIISANLTLKTSGPNDIIPNKTLILNEIFPEINNHEDLFEFNSKNGIAKEVPLFYIIRTIAQRLYHVPRTIKTIEPDWNWKIMASVALILSAFIYVVKCIKTADQFLGHWCCAEEPPLPFATLNSPVPDLPRFLNSERDINSEITYATPPSPRPIPPPSFLFEQPLLNNYGRTLETNC